MASRDKRDEQRLDQVDRRSQVSVSRALRARDASRPDPAAIAEALDKLEASGMQRFRPTETPGRTGTGIRGGGTPVASGTPWPYGHTGEGQAQPVPRPPTTQDPSTPAPPAEAAEATPPTPRTD